MEGKFISNVLNIVWDYRYIIRWAIIVVLYGLMEWNDFKARVITLMLDAKKLAKDGILKNGEQQVEWIILQVYQKLPKRYQLLNENTMKKIVKYLYDKAIDYIDDGELNNSTTVTLKPQETGTILVILVELVVFRKKIYNKTKETTLTANQE